MSDKKELVLHSGGPQSNAGYVQPAAGPELAIRPCLFHTQHLSGLLVDGMLYLHEPNGKRGRCPLPPSLPLRNGVSLRFAPPAPFFAPRTRWSPQGRAAFLNQACIDLPRMYSNLRKAFHDHIVFPADATSQGGVATLSLWTALTYVYPAWPAVPYLAIRGHYGSAKTRVLEILELLAFNATMGVSTSPAFVFRTLDSGGGTLLLDEAEQLGGKGESASQLHRILNAGYRVGGCVQILESFKGKRYPASFRVFGPKAIAGINPLLPSLESRCLRFTMCPAPDDAPEARRIVDPMDWRWMNLRDDLYSFALEHGATLAGMSKRDDLCDFGGRDYELWRPLFALADLFERAGVGGLVSSVRLFADSLREDREIRRVARADELLLRQLAAQVRTGCQSQLTPALLLKNTIHVEPGLFETWTAKRVSSCLAPYGIRTVKTNGSRVYRDISTEDMKKIERLYDLDLGAG